MKEVKEKPEIRISVHNLVEFIMRSGDIESNFSGKSRAVEGTRAHQKVQKSRLLENYQAEVSLSHSIEVDDYILTISGRADGIIKKDDQLIIEEIKSTNIDLFNIDENYNSLHWAQALVYAYIYAFDEGLEELSVQLTYFHLETEEVKELKKEYTFQELKDFFVELTEKYLYWADFIFSWNDKRNKSIKKLNFPFSAYRQGQRRMAVSVYKSIIDEKKLFVQAPTGIGKTISTLFPSIKAVAENRIEKIFYLTAKTVTRQIAEENLKLLYRDNLKLKSLTLTAKEKICLQEEKKCNPEICPYASGHFDRVNDALKEILAEEDLITREKIELYSHKHQVCPFEYSLDLALWVDLIICDYNYVFDPRVSLKRFFADEGGNYIFLIDEAHNLVDRAREMYSAELIRNNFVNLKDLLKKNKESINKGVKGEPYNKLLSYLNKIIELFESFKKEIGNDSFNVNETNKRSEFVYENSIVQKETPLEYYSLLHGFLNRAEEVLLINQKDEKMLEELLEEYFNVLSFIRITELYDENFIQYYQIEKDLEKKTEQKIKIFCLSPHGQLGQILKKGKTAIFFSATLAPLEYHREILGANENDYLLELNSPFDRNNISLTITPEVSTRYTEREKGYGIIADYIADVTTVRKGNYLVFFPSYAYMSAVVENFQKKYQGFKTIIQSRNMSEKERLEFIAQFDCQEAVTGFAVLGGVFSEGVDLKGEKLIGSIIIGVAHPRISLERDLIQKHFQEKNNSGYEYAYLYPGINKVLQAAGRTIRSETDRGVIVLIGERFNTYRYKKMFPLWWDEIKRIVFSREDIRKELNKFWRK